MRIFNRYKTGNKYYPRYFVSEQICSEWNFRLVILCEHLCIPRITTFIMEVDKLYEKYKPNNNLIIARVARKTIRYIEKNALNIPNQYSVLRNRIIDSCYKILEGIYRANIFQDINDKKEVVVYIQMLNFYLEECLRKELISNKKFLSYSNHLLELDKMIRSWFNYEKI